MKASLTRMSNLFARRRVPLLVLAALASSAAGAMDAGAKPCDAKARAAILKPATEDSRSADLSCDLTLSKGDVITRQIVIAGRRASGLTLDCKGATLDGGDKRPNAGRDMILIRSRGETPEEMARDRPTDVTIRNCQVIGSIRIHGLGTNGEAKRVNASSKRDGHTQRAQAAAPADILLDRVTLTGTGRIPLYLSPGVTGVTLRRSVIAGTSKGTGIYLDAESARNVIEDNEIRVKTRNREQLAVDGSAYNRIGGNRFSALEHGGVFLYRNCGEGGTVRHQPPTGNEITGNTFFYRSSLTTYPAVLLGARNGDSSYCEADAGHPFGSSLDDGDHADGNRVTRNRIVNRPVWMKIVDFGRRNEVSGNVFASDW